MARWSKVCPVDDLRPGEASSISVRQHPYAVFNADGVLYGLDGMCRHQQANLAAGYLNGTTVECAMHGWEYDLLTGECLTIPGETLQTFPVKIEGGFVWIELPDEISGDD